MIRLRCRHSILVGVNGERLIVVRGCLGSDDEGCWAWLVRVDYSMGMRSGSRMSGSGGRLVVVIHHYFSLWRISLWNYL